MLAFCTKVESPGLANETLELPLPTMATPPSIQIPIVSLYNLLRDQQIVNRSGGVDTNFCRSMLPTNIVLVASVACLVYDIIINMGQEVRRWPVIRNVVSCTVTLIMVIR